MKLKLAKIVHSANCTYCYCWGTCFSAGLLVAAWLVPVFWCTLHVCVDMRAALCNLHCVWLCSKGHGDPGYDGGFPPFHKSSGFPNSPQGYYNNKKVCSALTTPSAVTASPTCKIVLYGVLVVLRELNWTEPSPLLFPPAPLPLQRIACYAVEMKVEVTSHSFIKLIYAGGGKGGGDL